MSKTSHALKTTLGPLTKFGVFVTVTALAMGLLALAIDNTDFSDKLQYSAQFTDVTALNTGDDIRIAGVKVGSVDSIKVVDHRVAQVGFSLDRDVVVPQGVEATVKFRNLVGQRYISLEPGTDGQSQQLKPGSTIPLSQTKPALNLTTLFNGFQPLFQALQPDDMNKLSYEIIQVLQGEGGTIQSLLAHTASLTSTLANKDAVIGQVINNLNNVLDTVNSRTPEVSNLVIQVQQLVSGLAEDRKPIGDAITALGGLANTTSGLLADGRPALKTDIAQLNQLTQTLNQNTPLVQSFLDKTPGKLAAITRTASYGSWVNFFVCSTSGNVGISTLNINVPVTPLPIGQLPARCRE